MTFRIQGLAARLLHPLLGRYGTVLHEDLTSTYSRDIRKWLLIAPLIGVVTGTVITGIAVLILDVVWKRLLPLYLAHHWTIVPGLLVGFGFTGIIMRYGTTEPDEHSTEEIIRSYHEHQGDIDMRAFPWKLLAAVTTVGFGGSAALEGPSIYAGGAIGSWLWTKLRSFGLELHDRRIMLISGAAAGMAAVFRAPLTGLVFALEMPYKDDLAHEALLPSLIASVVAYATMAVALGTQPLFGFAGTTTFRAADLLWAALLGAAVGLIALVYDIVFQQVRAAFVHSGIPHPLKLVIGGLGTAICGWLFVTLYNGPLIPIGSNYEAVSAVLSHPHPITMLLAFAALKMIATICSLGSGGVSAMFVPLLLVGGCLGSAYAQLVVHVSIWDLYAAVGMAAFIAAGYKTPLCAVVFVAETTGGHSYLIPSLIGAAVAYAVSGEVSVSGDQRLRETAGLTLLAQRSARDVMQQRIVSVDAETTLDSFASTVAARRSHSIYPVYEQARVVGTVSIAALGRVPPDRWNTTTIGTLANRAAARVPPECDLTEALRLLAREDADQMLLVTTENGALLGIVTKTDILRSVGHGGAPNGRHALPPVPNPSQPP